MKGALTEGENNADLSGLRIAYDAFHLLLGGRPAPVVDGVTGDQRFFLGYAQVWRGKHRDASRLAQLTVDPHSPGEQRVDEVRNSIRGTPLSMLSRAKLYISSRRIASASGKSQSQWVKTGFAGASVRPCGWAGDGQAK